SEDKRLRSVRDAILEAGFELLDEGDGLWQVTAVPTRWKGTEKDLADELLDGSASMEGLVAHMYATAACRAACKDGDVLDGETAMRIVEGAFALAEPTCPHGRPVWIAVDREELFARIRRT
ncbi:MAG TPA: DNA mismatch repair protein MutL, partial [Treponemataceae bacterium]|nr:DNA mismatch repair protein MutL [Treponemataceae bacterium]